MKDIIDIRKTNATGTIQELAFLNMHGENCLLHYICGILYDKKAMKKIEETRSRLKRHDLEVEEVGKVLKEHVA